MNFRSLIRRFNFWQLFKIAKLAVRRPLFIIPTVRATRETMTICNSLYSKTHHQNGKTNAFRHALWNVLICQKTFRSSHNEQKSIMWAQNITNLHEKLAPNKPLEEAMDLHNNRIGRVYFSALKNAQKKEVLTFLKEKVNQAKFVKNTKEIADSKEDLVYLLEENKE